MKIENCELSDIDAIFRLYGIATAYQESKDVVAWPDFERNLVETEIAEKRQWKLMIDGYIACNWAITYRDPEIWEELDNNESIYIHRIATEPAYRGNNFVTTIVTWGKKFAINNGKKYIRLDTLGNNVKLIQHYTNAGFEFLGMHQLKKTASLPEHYQKETNCCLFEIRL